MKVAQFFSMTVMLVILSVSTSSSAFWNNGPWSNNSGGNNWAPWNWGNGGNGGSPWNNGPWQNGPWNNGPWSNGPWNNGPWRNSPWNMGPWGNGNRFNSGFGPMDAMVNGDFDIKFGVRGNSAVQGNGSGYGRPYVSQYGGMRRSMVPPPAR